jgi:ubiquinone/menaquinone biosynthesis C-methylase UbiE
VAAEQSSEIHAPRLLQIGATVAAAAGTAGIARPSRLGPATSGAQSGSKADPARPRPLSDLPDVELRDVRFRCLLLEVLIVRDRPNARLRDRWARCQDPNMTKPWMIDELAHAGPEHLDPGFIAGYDRKQGYPDATEDLAMLLEHGLDRTSTLVDLGAGTGRLALAAAPHVRRVVAVDVSPAMQSLLHDRAAKAGLPNIECVQAGFLSYEHTGPPADAVYTRNALHHLPDFWKAVALDRMARLLRPGGVLRLHDLVFDFQPAEAEKVLDRWLDDAAGDPSRSYTRQDFAEHIRTEFSTFRWLLEPMLAAAGFEIADAKYQGRLYGAYTCVKR